MVTQSRSLWGEGQFCLAGDPPRPLPVAHWLICSSDTTGPTLILLWYCLAKYPEYAERIYGELAGVDVHDPSALANLPQLNGFIKESMRLYPAALTMGSRVTPPEGVWFEDTFIPGSVKVAAPRYSIFRRKDYNLSVIDGLYMCGPANTTSRERF